MKYFYPLIISLSVFFVWFVPKENTDSTANVSFNKITKPTPKKIIVKSTKIGFKSNNDFSVAYPHDGHAPLAPTITLVKSVAVQGGGNAVLGGQLNYTVELSNTASGDANNATGVIFTDVLNSNLTLVTGSVKATPIIVDDSYNCIGNIGITVPANIGLLVNDVSPTNSAMTVTTINTAGTQGAVAVNPDGSFTFTPNAGYTGTTTFTYTASNGDFARTATVSIVVSAPIWFVNNAAASNGDGTLASPFKDWSNFATANALTGATDPAANQTIFVYSGTYTGAATLKAGQKVLGQGATVGLASFAGATVQSYTNTLPSTSGTKPTLTSSGITITLNSNNTLRGFDMGNSTRDIAGTNFGTLTTTEMALTGNGDALSLSTGVLNVDFTSITSTNSVLNSISIQTCSGSFSGGNTSLSGGAGSSLSLGTNSASFTFGILDIIAGNGQNAINTTGQSGTITCTSGTISSNAANVITISGVSSVSKAPLAMVLTSVTKTGTAQTSALKLTNTSGSFTVNGSGTTAGSGGTITNVTEKGVGLNNVSNITLKNMNFVNVSTTDATLSSTDYSVSNGGIVAKDVSTLTLNNISITGSVQRGISGHNVSNFSMTNCTVNNSGDNVNEGAIAFTNLSGTCSITGSTITRANEHLISIFNTSVNLNLTISNSNISDTQTTPAGTASAVVGTGILANTFGTGKTYITVSNCILNKIGADAIKMINNDTSTGSYEITGCSIDPVNAVTTPNDVGTAIEITSNETSTVYTNIHDNTSFSANGGNVVTIAPTENSTMHIKFTNNVITYKNGGISGGFRGIEIFGQNSARGYATITGNTVSGLPESNGIMVDNRSITDDAGTGRIDANISNNTVTLNYPNTAAAFGRCILIEAGNSTTLPANTICARVASNSTTTNGVNGHFRVSSYTPGSVLLEGNTDAATAWNANGNTPTTGNGGVVSVRAGSTVTMVAANTCIAPLNPPAFVALLADNKQIEEISNENARLAAIKKETLKDSLTAQEAISTVESKQTEKTTDDLAISATQNSVADINAGETVSVAGAGSGFTLPAGKSTTITFSAVISNSPSTCAITNTASVSGSNISTITSNTTTTNVVIPPPTGVTSATSICNGQSVSLSATCSSGEVQWYNAAATASLIGTGSPLSQSPSSNTTYQASCKVGGCESTRVNTGLITVNALPVPAPSSNSPVCSGNTLNLSSAASTSYLWAGPNTFTSSLRNPSITSVTTAANGIYTITQTNSFGCTASATLSVTINQTPTATIGSNSPICSGSSLNLTSSGGDTYSWSGPNSFTSSLQNPSIANTTVAATGTYIVTVTSNGCTATNSVVVTVNASPTPNPNSNSPVCSGNTLNLSSVTGMTTYAWSGPNSFTSSIQSPSISNVTTVEGGIYTVTVTNSNGCSASATTAITINQTPTPNIGSNSPVNITNTLNLTSGTASTYLWAGPNSFTSSIQNPSITNVTTAATGTYTVTLTTNGCSASATTAVVISEATANSNSPVCTGNSLNLSSLGGGTYSWTGPNSFTSSSQNPSIANVTAAAAGTYTVTVTNGLSTATATTVVIVYTTPVPNPSSDSPKCEGTTLTFSSVAAMTNYTWTGPNSFSSSIQTPSISSVTTAASGTYTLTVTNANGCTASATTAVTINANPVPNPSSDSPKCEGTTLNFNSVAAMTSYTWTGPNSFSSSIQAPSISSVTTAASGTYTLTVTNANGCSASATTAVTINANPVPNPSSDSPKCVGTTLNFNSVAAMTNYTWTGPNSFSSSIQAPSISSVTTAASGTYTLIVTNANGCTASATTAVTINANPVPNPSSDSPKCVGTTLNFSSVAAMTNYTWTGPNSFSSSIQTPSISSVTTAASGTYALTVTNANGCTASATTAVTINANPVPNPSSDSPKCEGTTLNFNSVAAMTSYTWTGPNSFSSSIQAPSISSVTTAASGTYTLTVTNANGCTASATTAVTTNANPVPNPSSDSPKCVGTTLTFSSVAEMTNYTWTGPNSFSSSIQTPSISSVTTAASGTYTLIVTNANGCITSATTAVTINANPVPNPSSDSPKCVGTTLTFSSVAAMTNYTWTGPNSFSSSIQTPSISSVTTAASGTYTLTVTNANGCTASATTAVTINANPVPNPSSDSPKCVGTTLTFSSVAAMTNYTWTGPNSFSSSIQAPSISSVTTAASGTYTLIVTNANGCITSATTAVTINANPVPNPSSDSPKCIGTTLTFNSVAAMTSYTWTGPNSFSSSIQTPSISSVTTAASGTYTLTVTNANGCTASATTAVIINQTNPPTITPPTSLSVCSPSTLTLTANGCAGTVTWSEGAATGTTLTLSAVGTYSISAICTVNGCNSEQSLSITGLEIKAKPNAPTITPPTSLSVCSPSTLTLTANGCAGTVTWSEGAATGTTLTLSAVGTYSISAICTVNGCNSDASILVNGLEIKAKPNAPKITPPISLSVCSPSTLTLTADGCAGTVTWSEGAATGTTLTLSAVGTYSISATCTVNGCNSDQSLSITGLEIKASPIITATNTGPYKVGQIISLTGTGAVSYNWTGPNNFSSTLSNPTIPNALSVNGGVYSLSVTGVNGCNTVATTNVIVSGIDPCDPTRIVDYLYVQAGNPYQPLFPLTDGMVINQRTDQVSILVNPVCPSVTIESFEMNIQGPELNWNILQNVSPYALFDNFGNDVWGRNFKPGVYTLTVTGYAQDNKGGGITYGPKIITFTVVGDLATINAPTLSKTVICAGSSVDVSFTTTGTFNGVNQFQVELSDSSGSFAAPVLIGTTNTTGTLNCTIPQNTLEGSKYLIRVASTNQVVVSNPAMGLITVHPFSYTLINPDNNLTGTSTKKAVSTINASNKVISPANVTYQAGNSILLTPGFESGAVFKAEIQGCNN